MRGFKRFKSVAWVAGIVSLLGPVPVPAEQGDPCGQTTDYFKPDPMNENVIVRRHKNTMEAGWYLANVHSGYDFHDWVYGGYMWDHQGIIGGWHDPCDP